MRTHPRPLDGMRTRAAGLTAEETAACYALIDSLATMLKADGDPRRIGELRAAVLSDLIRRPGDDTRPAVTAQLRITTALDALAGRSDRAAEPRAGALR